MNANNEQITSSEAAADGSEQPILDVSVAAAAATPAGDRVWDALAFTHKEVFAYNTVPGMLIPHLRDKELIAKVASPKLLLQNVEILNRDATEMRSRLAEIFDKHKERVGNSMDDDDSLAAIQINEEYMQWAMTYESVVVPNVINIMSDLMDAGAAGLDPQQFAHPTAAVVAGANDVPDLNLDAGSMSEEQASV